MKSMLSDTLAVILPTSAQTSLLRACLCQGETGRKAGETWLKQRHELQHDHREDFSKSLLPLLFGALRRNGVVVDEMFLTVLRTASVREELRAKTYRRICRDVFAAFSTAGIPAVVLKGAALADTVYADLALRHCHDIDLLLGEPDPSRAISLLASLGFTPPREERGAEWQDIQLAHHSGLPLVLHRQLFHIPLYNAVMPDLWARSQTQIIAEVPARILSPADQLLHVCGHAASCASRESLRWVCDAWFLIERHPRLDWDVLFACAVRSHLALPLSVMLCYLAEGLQAPIPVAFLERLCREASQADTIERQLALRGARVGSRGRFKNLLRMTGDQRTRFFVLRWILFPSPSYLCQLQQTYSPCRLPFYYVSRPLRYVVRCVRRYWKNFCSLHNRSSQGAGDHRSPLAARRLESRQQGKNGLQSRRRGTGELGR
jgi:Uncharacterised nucleotidyltransferase